MSKIIGLKDAFHKPDGQHIWYWFRDLMWQFRYAWQRAWKGYDFTDVFDLGFNFAAKMPVLLREFKEHNVGLFHDPDTGRDLTEEETDAVIDELIFYFENTDEWTVYKRMFGIEGWEDEEFCLERDRQSGEECKRCWKEAMRLFARWANQLWY